MVVDTEGRTSKYYVPEEVLEVGGVVTDPKLMTNMIGTLNKKPD